MRIILGRFVTSNNVFECQSWIKLVSVSPFVERVFVQIKLDVDVLLIRSESLVWVGPEFSVKLVVLKTFHVMVHNDVLKTVRKVTCIQPNSSK